MIGLTTDSFRKESIVYIGDKDITNYAVAINSALLETQVACIKARGQKISKIFDILEFLKSRFGLKVVVTKVNSTTEAMMPRDGHSPKNVTAVDVIIGLEPDGGGH